ncbi:hypothetical protein EON83_26160 [bacterium]|nr:MAG: hypothetical protein EON83_26160 [bacterium]
MHIVRRLYLPLLIVLCALWAFGPLEGGDDFWAHAALGRIFLETGHIPKSTMFLWSADIPWVFHAYGSGIIYATLLNLGGPWLALCLNFALAVIPLLLIWRLAKNRAGEVPLTFICLLVPALWFSSVRWRLRPEGFTVLFLTLTLLFLVNEKRSRWNYFAIAAMFALWPNLHGGVLIGILTMWVGFIGESVQIFLRSGKVAASEAPLAEAETDAVVVEPAPRRIDWSFGALAVACSILPLLCNPWGLAYRSVFGGTAATSSHIAEWRQFWVYPAMTWYVAWGLCLLCAICILVWSQTRRRPLGIGAVLLMMCALWISSRRHMWVTSITCMVVLAQGAGILNGQKVYAAVRNSITFVASRLLRKPTQAGEVPQLDSTMRLIGQIGTLIILLCACIAAFPDKGFRAVGKTVPIGMSSFLLTRGPTGRVFNDYEYSAALEWYLKGQRPLYIDLINAYPPKIFDDWFPIAHAEPAGIKMLDSLKIDVVALRPVEDKKKKDPIYNLIQYLKTSPQWQHIYKGVDGNVWSRRKLYNAPITFNAGLGVHPQKLPRP